MSIDTFLEEWNDSTVAITSELAWDRRLHQDVLEVHLTKSGRDNTVRLNALKSNEQKKGHSSKFLKWLTKEADEGKFILSVCVQPWGYSFESSPSKENLKDWFERHGFVVKWKYPDEKGYEMERSPIKGKKK